MAQVAQASAGDELPILDQPFPLDPAAVADFAAHGHVVVRGLGSPAEATAYHPIIEAAAVEHAWNKDQAAEPGSYASLFLQSFNLWRVDERIARFVLATRFAGVAAALLGVERVRLYHDQALCKEPRRRPHALAPGPVLLAARHRPHDHDVDAARRPGRRRSAR